MVGGNPHRHGENMQTPHTGPRRKILDSNPGLSCCEATVLITKPLCRPWYRFVAVYYRGVKVKQNKKGLILTRVSNRFTINVYNDFLCAAAPPRTSGALFPVFAPNPQTSWVCKWSSPLENEITIHWGSCGVQSGTMRVWGQTNLHNFVRVSFLNHMLQTGMPRSAGYRTFFLLAKQATNKLAGS